MRRASGRLGAGGITSKAELVTTGAGRGAVAVDGAGEDWQPARRVKARSPAAILIFLECQIVQLFTIAANFPEIFQGGRLSSGYEQHEHHPRLSIRRLGPGDPSSQEIVDSISWRCFLDRTVDVKRIARFAHPGRIEGSWREWRQVAVRLPPVEFRKMVRFLIVVAGQRAANFGQLRASSAPAVAVVAAAASVVTPATVAGVVAMASASSRDSPDQRS